MSAVASAARQRLDIGKVTQDVFGVLADNWLPFLLAAALLTGLPTFVNGLAQVLGRTNPVFGLLSLAGSIANLIGLTILQGALIYGSIRTLDGNPATLGDCLKVGAKRWLPMLGLLILMGLGMFLGLLLLVVPGILLILRWSVAAPALVMEGRGIQGSMGRSADLTQGRRGSIFLLFLVLWILVVVCEAAMIGVAGGFRGLLAMPPAVTLIATPLLATLTNAVWPVLMAALFQQLRDSREGGAPETLAEVFA
jgi:hypothetical protein